MKYLGDYAEDYATLNFKFSTHKADGTPITLGGTPAVSVYKANSTTQSTAGITLSVDFDSVTGLHNVLIDLSADAFYAVANDYSVVITTGTVDSVSVVGTVLAQFSIENRFAETTTTAIAANAITATAIQDDAITAAKLNTGAITADAFAADAIVAATLATGAITADAFAADAIVAATLATGAISADAIAANTITATAIADDAITAAKLNTGAITADAFAADAIVAATLATGALTADAFAADALVAATFATGALTADAFAANAITNTAVADDVDVNVKTISANAITATAINADAITEAKIADAALSTEHFNAAFYTRLGIVAYGTAQATLTDSTHVQLASATSYADDFLNGAVVVLTGGTGAGQSRLITDWDQSDDLATVDTWTTTPDGTSTYVVFAAAPASATSVPAVNVTQWLGTAVATPTTGGVPEVDVTHAAGTAWGSGAITAASIATGAIDADAIADNAIDAGAIATGAITAAKFAAGAIDAAAIAADAIDADAIAATAGAEIGNAVWASTTRILTAATNITSTGGTTVPQTGDSYARLGAPAGASVSADIAAIEAQTDDIGAAGAGLTAIPWNAAWDAEVQSEVTDALNAYDPPTTAEMEARTLVAADYVVVGDTLAAVTTVGSVTGAVGSVTGNVGGNVTGSVGSVAAGGITASSIATGAIDADALAADAVDEILDEVIEGSYTMRQALRLFLAALGGKVSGAGTTTVTFRDTGDSTDRIVATVDGSGNRTAITLTLT